MFGTSRIDLALNEQQRLNISLHNSKVKENREILKVLINGTCYLANQELAFCGNNVRLRLIVAITSNLFTLLLKTMKEFLVIWRLPQCFLVCHDIIEAVAEIIRTDIRKDINKASFVAVEVDETTDVTSLCM